jgi:predicted enzyme related to lactoylglutathione lyase
LDSAGDRNVDSVLTNKSKWSFLGLRTARYTARDLAAAKAWYADVLGFAPYFDEPFYVGFNVGGFELGITPDANAALERPEAGVAYWGVTGADDAYARLISLGAAAFEPVQDVGGGIRIGAVRDPFGNVLGVIENPHFKPA